MTDVISDQFFARPGGASDVSRAASGKLGNHRRNPQVSGR